MNEYEVSHLFIFHLIECIVQQQINLNLHYAREWIAQITHHRQLLRVVWDFCLKHLAIWRFSFISTIKQKRKKNGCSCPVLGNVLQGVKRLTKVIIKSAKFRYLTIFKIFPWLLQQNRILLILLRFHYGFCAVILL